MKPGDLVRVRNLIGAPFEALHGKIGVVVEETPPPRLRRAYKVLVDGCIYHFYQESLESLELVNEAG
jgi:hypothetical protein